MKRIFYLLLAVVMFAGCSKENENLSELERIKQLVSSTELLAADILKSAQYWQSDIELYYTEPDGKGVEYAFDRGNKIRGDLHINFSVEKEAIELYLASCYMPVGPPMPQRISKNYIMSEIGNNNWALSYFNGNKYYFKILAYDDNKVLVASNLWQCDNNDTHFGHSVILFTRQNTRPEWFDECISEEEYLETYSE